MNFIGHQRQWRFLVDAAKSGRLAHAYLFSGPAQLGKRTLAKTFVQWIFCSANGGDSYACGACRSCRHVEAASHPDAIFVKPERKSSSTFDRPKITIEQIRELRTKLSLGPALAFQKFVIIDDAETLGTESANALLKTLEEPTGNTHFFLITGFPYKILPTIRSRAEHLWFGEVSEEEIADWLRKTCRLTQSSAQEFARYSFGLPGLAVTLAKTPETLERDKKNLAAFTAALNLPRTERYAYIESFTQLNQSSLLNFIDTAISYLRRSHQNLRPPALFSSLFLARKLVSETNVSPRFILEMLILNQL